MNRPSTPRRARIVLAGAVAALPLLATGCGVTGGAAEPTPTATATDAPTAAPGTPAPQPEPVTVPWGHAGETVELDGWTLTLTEGPMIEVTVAGDLVGIVELLSYPLAEELAAAAAEGAEQLSAALALEVASHHEVIARDRRDGIPGPGYTYRPLPNVPTSFGGVPALRYGAELVEDASGRVVESNHGVMAVHAGQQWVLAVNGADPDLFASDLVQLTPADAAALATELPRITPTSPLP